MEIESFNNNEQLNEDYYQQEYNGQNVEKTPSFKKWYENCLKQIKIKNESRLKNIGSGRNRFLCIFYCPNCTKYVTCSYNNEISCVQCNKCKVFFCPGCNFFKPGGFESPKLSVCLKGYWILWWLRVKNCISDLEESCLCFYIIHIISCIFFTPLYLGFITFIIGFLGHRDDGSEKYRDKATNKIIFCFLFALLMFPYIIIFVPIMVLILIPGIFNHDYYIHIFIAYVTAIGFGHHRLKTFY